MSKAVNKKPISKKRKAQLKKVRKRQREKQRLAMQKRAGRLPVSGWVLIVALLLFMLPMLYLLVRSLETEGTLNISQYIQAFENGEFVQRLENSLRITCIALALHIPISLAGGLFLWWSKNRYKKALLISYLLVLLLPFQVVMLPVFQMSMKAGLYDTQRAVILLAMFHPLGTLMLYVIIGALPKDQWEAAALDTGSLWKCVRYILLPQILPAMAALALLAFAEFWNMVEQPLILLQSDELKPLSLLFNDITRFEAPYRFAGAVIYILPIFLCYAVLGGFLKKRYI